MLHRQLFLVAALGQLIAARTVSPVLPGADAGQEKSVAQSQQEEGKKVLDLQLVCTKIRGPLPLDPHDKAWTTAKELTVKLIPQTVQEPKLLQPSIETVRARALNDAGWIAVRLEWSDSTPDVTLRSDRFGDAAAVEFPMKDSPMPDFRMGNDDNPVHLLLWRADRQMAKYTGKTFLELNYPRAVSDVPVQTPRAKESGKGNSPAADDSAAKSAGNHGVPGTAPVIEELNAATWNQMTVQKQQHARGAGQHVDGRWHVVFARPLASGDANDATLASNRPALIAFGVWDGGRQNAASRKMVSEGWVWLKIER